MEITTDLEGHCKRGPWCHPYPPRPRQCNEPNVICKMSTEFGPKRMCVLCRCLLNIAELIVSCTDKAKERKTYIPYNPPLFPLYMHQEEVSNLTIKFADYQHKKV